jgi:hypothetical protein
MATRDQGGHSMTNPTGSYRIRIGTSVTPEEKKLIRKAMSRPGGLVPKKKVKFENVRPEHMPAGDAPMALKEQPGAEEKASEISYIRALLNRPSRPEGSRPIQQFEIINQAKCVPLDSKLAGVPMPISPDELRQIEVNAELGLEPEYGKSIRVDLSDATKRLLYAGFGQIMGQFALREDFSINDYKEVLPHIKYYAFCAAMVGNTSERQNGRDLLDGVRAIIESEDKN